MIQRCKIAETCNEANTYRANRLFRQQDVETLIKLSQRQKGKHTQMFGESLRRHNQGVR